MSNDNLSIIQNAEVKKNNFLKAREELFEAKTELEDFLKNGQKISEAISGLLDESLDSSTAKKKEVPSEPTETTKNVEPEVLEEVPEETTPVEKKVEPKKKSVEKTSPKVEKVVEVVPEEIVEDEVVEEKEVEEKTPQKPVKTSKSSVKETKDDKNTEPPASKKDTDVADDFEEEFGSIFSDDEFADLGLGLDSDIDNLDFK